jgi:hypothetical protein
MESKLKTTDFIAVMNSLEVVEKLPKSTFDELFKVFKIESSNNDIVSNFKKFKNKIADIFCTEG